MVEDVNATNTIDERVGIIGTVNLYVVHKHHDTLASLIDAYGFQLRKTKQRGVYVVEWIGEDRHAGKYVYSLRDAATQESLLAWRAGEPILQETAAKVRRVIGNKSDVIVHEKNYAEITRILELLDLDYEEFMPIKEGGRNFLGSRR